MISQPPMVSTPNTAREGDEIGRFEGRGKLLTAQQVAAATGTDELWVTSRMFALPCRMQMDPPLMIGVYELDLPKWIEAAR